MHLPDALGAQQWMGRQPLGRHLRRSQPCTCRSHCHKPKRQRPRHTSCIVLVGNLRFKRNETWRVVCQFMSGVLSSIPPSYMSFSISTARYLHTSVDVYSNLLGDMYKEHSQLTQCFSKVSNCWRWLLSPRCAVIDWDEVEVSPY